MNEFHLYPNQIDAIKRMHNGCILYGEVGSGKTCTSIAYYLCVSDRAFWQILTSKNQTTKYLLNVHDLPKLYIITTAQKRDKHEWEADVSKFQPLFDKLGVEPAVVIDSWNNIKKYEDVCNSFFIFDEQRVVGYGTWAKTFIKISKKNSWILLSATPGDAYCDYIPVFIANGFYKNKTEFECHHVVYNRFVSYKQVDRYVGTKRLDQLIDAILVPMKGRPNKQNHIDILVDYDAVMYKLTMKNRWDYDKDEPIDNAAKLCYTLRKLVNSDESRKDEVLRICRDHPKVIIFYNFDYELDILRGIDYPHGTVVTEWNGHRHIDISKSDRWVHLVQYTAGAEGWNCIETDTMIFYSQNYSYKTMIQSAGRIDRVNTPFKELYYYHLKSNSKIDLVINAALKNKKNFNERRYFNDKEFPNKKV